jgi:hypothetical protein
MGGPVMTVIKLRRPGWSRRSVLHTVQRIANEIAKDNGGKIPDVFLIDAAIKRELMRDPELLDLDRAAMDQRKYWERVNNSTINSRKGSSSLFIPSLFVPVGKRVKGRMKDLDPITEVAAWLEKDQQVMDNFNNTMNWRQGRKLKIIEEANRNRDCKTWGALETKLRGWAPTPTDDELFPDADGAPAADDDDEAATASI